MVLPWTFLLLVLVLTRLESVELLGEHDVVIGYQIQGATLDLANDVYVCSDKAGTISSVCTGISNRLVISSAYVMVNETAQKRWFIASMDDKSGSVPVPKYIYGAIELSSTPWLLKTWKRIGGDWDPGLTVTPIHTFACSQAMTTKSSSATLIKELVTTATTVFWIMLSYSSASSLFTTTYPHRTDENLTSSSSRFTSPIGQCVFLFQQHLNLPFLGEDDKLAVESTSPPNTQSRPQSNSLSNNPDSISSSEDDLGGIDEGHSQDMDIIAAEIARCDWVAFVGSSLSTVCSAHTL